MDLVLKKSYYYNNLCIKQFDMVQVWLYKHQSMMHKTGIKSSRFFYDFEHKFKDAWYVSFNENFH